MKKRNYQLLIGLMCISLFLMLASMTAGAQNMSVNPFKINLNAQGAAENIQCAYPGTLPSGYSISGQDIQLYFAGGYVTDAYAVGYCAIDDMIFVRFDWMTVISSPVLLPLANTGQVGVNITGYFTVTNSAGDSIDIDVNRSGYAEVIKPGNRK